MAITLPIIEIIFKQLATSFVERSARGIAVLIVKDDTNKTFNVKTYTTEQEVANDSALYTAANLQYINDALFGKPSKLIVIRIDVAGTIAQATALIESATKTGWVTIAGGVAGDYTSLITWVKAKEALQMTYKLVVFNATTPDCKHVANFVNTNVVFKDDRATQTGDKYLPTLAGILAGCNVKRGSTYYPCTNLASVTETADNNAAVNAGKLILINEVDKVVIGLGVNSLTTFDTTNKEDMRYIDIVEAMDMMNDDIRTTFKNDFLGKGVKNSYDNQILFLSAVNTYFKALETEEILDNKWKNVSFINVAKQRATWVLTKPEAVDWDDAKVKNTPYKRSMFAAADVKINGSLENLGLEINMN